jgi:hypothetical protein
MAVQSKSFLASPWHQIDAEWAAELVGLRMKVCGSFWNGCTKEEKRTFYGGIIKEYNHDKRRWLIRFDNDDEDQFMRYDAVIKFADEGADTFHNYRLPAVPITPAEEEAVHHNVTYVMADKLDHPTVPDMTPIPYTAGRGKFDVDITEEGINSMKDSNGTIRFMNVMRWCLPQFDDGTNINTSSNLFTWQAHQMSNYLRHLLTKQLDITTDPLKPGK